ncbi:M48 family metallopeptidase [Hymenobacter aerilatus]|uniref:M48 family metallopeptidase n=1 Tax=Hymenobacter aerilatus TaxID=2932251 RepID=A0A8T9SZJ2_9BACT|nr:M48 family metallopeptidase [Hymenobacter aerilatus]UOR05256.1 M48 family metallopeptidase [Hymenobacter aerilatus]
MATALYPASTTQLPTDFTASSSNYRLMVGATLLSIVLFLAIYIALLVGAGYLLYWVATMPFGGHGTWPFLLHLGAVVAAAMLLVFLLKFVFKSNQTDHNNHLRLVPEAHPQLLAFIEQLCADTGAPRPKHIYLSSEVNAAVFYERPLLSLIWPVRKNLLIGAGLVNALTLSEFKATLAHEFGHFAQSSMRLGSYVYSANLLLHDIVYGRDKWDEMLDRWRRLDIRVSAVAWGLTALVWLVRKVLELAYQGVNLVHARLSREMEFQADRVAVRVAGSAALVNTLYQVNRAQAAYQLALAQLGTALEHSLVTDDVFYHQTLRLQDDQTVPATFRASTTSTTPTEFLFKADEVTLKADMYASHPADYLREQHAYATFVSAPADDRSPWLLFTQPDDVRRLVTAKLYQNSAVNGSTPPVAASEVEAFLSAETSGMTYHTDYAEVYDHRLIADVPLSKAQELATELPSGLPLLAQRTSLYGPDLQERMAAFKTRQQDLEKLALFTSKQTRDTTFTVAGTSYPAQQADIITQQLVQQNHAHTLWVEEFDERSAALHWHLLEALPTLRAEWQARYELQLHLRNGFITTRNSLRDLHVQIQEIIKLGELTAKQRKLYITQFGQLEESVSLVLKASQITTLLPLSHLEAFATIGSYVLQDMPLPTTVVLDDTWLNTFANLLDTTMERYRRLYFKNLGVVLRLQEQAAAEYATLYATAPEALTA